MSRPKVLIVSYLFPPIAGGGVPRPLKMAKYLPRYGWDPVILTVNPKYHVSLDKSLLSQVPEGTPIYRAWEWNPYEALNRLRVQGSPQKESPVSGKPAGGAEQPATRGNGLKRLGRGLFSLLKKLKNYLLIPDDHIFWVPFAIREGLKAIRQNRVEVIFSTSGPYSCHLVGYALARLTGLPWIADFRDPWTQNMHRPGIAWRERLEERMERQVMTRADCITTVTHAFAENFRRKYPGIKRMEVIHNGFDPEDYVDIPVQKQEGRLTFAYTGIFYRERNPRLFLRAVSELIREGKLRKEDLLIRFAGVFDYPGYTENQDAVHAYGLNEIVEVLGYLPHRESLSLLKSSDVLLLIGDTAPGSEAYIPGKLYEYMAVRRPILALSLSGESTRIIERFGIGQVVDPADLDAIKGAVQEFYSAWKAGELDRRFSFDLEKESLAIYQRDKQAEMLARVMNEIRR